METINLIKIANDAYENYPEQQQIASTPTTYAKPAGLASGIAGVLAGNNRANKLKLKGKAGVVTRLGTGLFWGGLGTLGGSYIDRK